MNHGVFVGVFFGSFMRQLNLIRQPDELEKELLKKKERPQKVCLLILQIMTQKILVFVHYSSSPQISPSPPQITPILWPKRAIKYQQSQAQGTRCPKLEFENDSMKWIRKQWVTNGTFLPFWHKEFLFKKL